MAKPGTRPGTKFTEAHKANMVKARKNNPRWDKGRRSAARKLKGRKPADVTIAASLATRYLKKLDETRCGSPKLWERKYQEFLGDRMKQVA